MSPWLPPDGQDGHVLAPFSDMNIVPHETHFDFCTPCITAFKRVVAILM